MRRVLVAVTIGSAIASAYGLYAVTTLTRRLDHEVSALERQRDRLAAEIGVLAAERAYLARPDRIEPLARLNGLGPLAPDQIVTRAEFEAKFRDSAGAAADHQPPARSPGRPEPPADVTQTMPAASKLSIERLLLETNGGTP
jgi:cell division protein FtsL